MGKAILTEKNLKLIVAISILASLLAVYFFYDRMFNQFSYLLLNAKGEVFRKISQPYLYRINFAGVIYGIMAVVCLTLTWFYLFFGSEKEELEKIIAEENIKLKSANSDDSNVFYGKGLITQEAIKEFVRDYNESAVKYIFHRNIDGSSLDNSLRKLHHEWAMRGMTDEMVKEEILKAIGTDVLDERNLYEIVLDLREKTQGISRAEELL